MQVLMIDDDVELCSLAKDILGQSGVSLDYAHNSETGIAMFGEKDYEILILDVMLPGSSGFDILQRIRITSDVIIIMLTAKGDEADKIKGLDLGADDYLAKPFRPEELLARMRAIRRRTNKQQNSNIIEREDVVFHPSRNEVELKDSVVSLTGVESVILRILMTRAGEPVTREHLYTSVLNREPSPYDRSLDTHVSSLRKKLGPSAKGNQRILSVRGVGYQYA